MVKENPQTVKRMVRAIVRSVIHTRDYPEDALTVSMKRLGLDRDAAQDAYQMIRQALVPVPDRGPPPVVCRTGSFDTRFSGSHILIFVAS
jgi:hypothetical protein